MKVNFKMHISFPGMITFLSDFGDRDWFVAAVKGEILKINKKVLIVDITHTLIPHDVRSAAFLLKSVYRNFPSGTVHLVVVDPGVGSERIPVGAYKYQPRSAISHRGFGWLEPPVGGMLFSLEAGWHALCYVTSGLARRPGLLQTISRSSIPSPPSGLGHEARPKAESSRAVHLGCERRRVSGRPV